MGKKNVLILSNYFEPNYSYQEVQIAEEFYKQGYNVSVIACDTSQFDSGKKVTSNKPYKVYFVDKYLRISTTIFYCFNSRSIAKEFLPDYVILIHPNMGLSHHIGKHFIGKAKLIAIYGDTVPLLDRNFKKRMILNVFKKRWITTYLNTASVFANTNRTVKILKSIYKKKIDNLEMLGIGYNSDYFYQCDVIRNKERQRLNVENNIVLVTATRIVPEKKIIEHISPVLDSLGKNKDMVYVIAGFDETIYSKQVREFVQNHANGNQVITLDMLNPNQLLALFNASDYGFWYRAAISIQQAMGTGLYVFLEEQDWLDHLIDSGINGEYVKETDFDRIFTSLSLNKDRKHISELNKNKFSYNILTKKYLQSAK